MKVRLLKPLNFKKVGTILDVPGGTAETWIMQRKAELVPDDPPGEKLVPNPNRAEKMVPQGRHTRKMTA